MKTKANRERYQKLPGRRRGLLLGSSVWLGSDHLLLVRSNRFREEYKRLYLRDVQAIVIAEANRYHISSRSALIGMVLLLALTIAVSRDSENVAWGIGGGFLALVLFWVYLSSWRSCRCRIYTAVSSEDLQSVYRTWTARRFLQAVEPHIHAAQGQIEGAWAEAVEEQQIGPLPVGRIGLANPEGIAAPPSTPEALRPTRTLSTAFLALSLCVGGIAELLTLRFADSSGKWVVLVFVLLQIAAAAAVLIQSFAKGLRASMRNLAIATIAFIGLWYYGIAMSVGFAVGAQSARQGRNAFPFGAQAQPMTVFEQRFSRGSAGAISLILGVACAILLLRDEAPAERLTIRA